MAKLWMAATWKMSTPTQRNGSHLIHIDSRTSTTTKPRISSYSTSTSNFNLLSNFQHLSRHAVNSHQLRRALGPKNTRTRIRCQTNTLAL